MTFEVAGIPVALEGARWEPAEAFATEDSPELTVEVRAGAVGADAGLRVVRARSGWRYETRTARGELDLERGRAALALAPGSRALEGFLRFALGTALLRHGGLLLHAAAVARAGSGFAFLGPSGAGKSTIARLAREGGAQVLGDELVAARGGRVYATPFASRGSAPGERASAPLALVCVLEQAKEHAFAPLARAEVARALLRQTVAAAELGAELALRAATEIAAGAPGGVLHFALDPTFWEVLPN